MAHLTISNLVSINSLTITSCTSVGFAIMNLTMVIIRITKLAIIIFNILVILLQ
jgi:hypothetical protein